MNTLQDGSTQGTTAWLDRVPRIFRLIKRFWGEALVIAVVLLLWTPRLSGPIDLRWDASMYYMLGTSLIKGEGYRIASEPGSPEALQYPPLLPMIAGLHQWLSGTTSAAIVGPRLRITYAIIFLAYALVVLALARRFLRPPWAVAATLLCLLNPLTVYLSDLFFAELPFAVLTVLFALVADDRIVKRSRLRELSAFSLATAAFLLRTAGLALLVAWVAQALIQRRWKLALARVFPAILPVLLWQMYIAQVQKSDEYRHPAYDYQRAPYQYYNVSYAENISLIEPFRPALGHLTPSAFAARIITNVPALLGSVGEVVTAKEEDWHGTLLWAHVMVRDLHLIRRLVSVDGTAFFILAFEIAVLAGLLVLFYRRQWLFLLILLGSAALVCTTPWPEQFTRYLEPLSPFLSITALVGLTSLSDALQAHRLRWSAILMRGIAGLLLLCAATAQIHTLLWLFSGDGRGRVTFAREQLTPSSKWFLYDRTWQAWQKNVDWVDTHAPPNSIVATTAAPFYYLQTGRLAVLPPMEIARDEERRLLDSVPVSYVIVDEFGFQDISWRYAYPALKAHPTDWHVAYSVDQTRVYQRSRSSP